jgi:hypothetical protein
VLKFRLIYISRFFAIFSGAFCDCGETPDLQHKKGGDIFQTMYPRPLQSAKIISTEAVSPGQYRDF